MIIKLEKKKEYTMVKRSDLAIEEMARIEIMKVTLSCFPHDVLKPTIDSLEFGYVELGHGLKGKKDWILDEGVKKFVEKWRGKRHGECTLWCYSKREDKKHTKRSQSKSPCAKLSKPRSSQYDSHVSKMAKVDEIYQSLDAVTVNSGTARQVLVIPLRSTPPSTGCAVSSSCQPLHSQPSTLVQLA